MFSNLPTWSKCLDLGDVQNVPGVTCNPVSRWVMGLKLSVAHNSGAKSHISCRGLCDHGVALSHVEHIIPRTSLCFQISSFFGASMSLPICFVEWTHHAQTEKQTVWICCVCEASSPQVWSALAHCNICLSHYLGLF